MRGKQTYMRRLSEEKTKTNYKLTLEACKEADEKEGIIFTNFEDFKRHIYAL